MKIKEHKIDKALQQQPNYSQLDNLSEDVWRKIRSTRKDTPGGFVMPVSFKIATLGLSLLAVFAFAQVLSQNTPGQSDLFDLRYFSYQSTPTLNLASVETYKFTP